MLTLTTDLTSVTQAIAALRARMQHPIPTAVRHQAGQAIAATWEATAQGLRLPGMTRSVREPAARATVEVTSDGVRVTMPADVVAKVEGGTPAWNMKPGLLHGPKSRVGRTTGLRYNIIPFRHRAEDIPDAALWAALQGIRYVGSEGMRTSLNAPWLLTNQLRGYTWRTGRYTGLRLTAGGAMTFRTVSERSPAASWWYPPRPGTPWAEPVWQWVAEAVTAWWIRAWEEAVFGDAGSGDVGHP